MNKTVAILLLALPFLAGPVTARNTEQPVIISVVREAKFHQRSGEGRHLFDRFLPKFLDGVDSMQTEVFHIVWSPPYHGLESGFELILEYRQQNLREQKTFRRLYPFHIQQAQKLTVPVTLKDYRAGGPITAWRARIVRGGSVLTERRSRSWDTLAP